MSDTREKLKKLIFESLCKHMDKSCKLPDNIADDLLANGVTVQEWVPVSEPPKEWKHKNGVAINFLVYTPEYGIDIGNYLKPANAWLCMGIPCNAAHWMPLPELPKGE